MRKPEYHRGRRRGRLAALLMALLVVVGLSSGTAMAGTDKAAPQIQAKVRVPARAMDAVAAMQPSWNVGNTLDAIPDETSWGNPLITKALFDTIRAQGFRSVRIPVTWSSHQSATAPYTIDATFMARVKQVVDWAQADGLYVVMNVHHDNWQWISKMSTDHDNVVARFNSSWTQISSAFRDEPRTLLFESINEPLFDNATAAQKTQFLNELNVSFHRVVRASGGGNTTRLLALPTQNCGSEQNFVDDLNVTISALHDSNLVASIHFYGWFPFSVNAAGGMLNDAAAQKNVTDSFARMHDSFIAKGIPVYLGEYGLLSWPDNNHPPRVERGEALKYFQQVSTVARAAGITTALWDAFNYLNRDTLQWRDPALFAWIKSSWTTRSGTASFDTVYVPKSSPVAAHSLTLNLNGTAFLGLWQGSTPLLPGRDYTLSGNKLTLTAGALTRLTGNRAYGVNSTIRARFSRGIPWNIDIVTNDSPVLANSTGTADAFTIPTQYRGDAVAGMEATYADGSNAGPLSWNPYQEFNVAFSPDYSGGTTILTPAFFAALHDNAPVKLVFHYYSGATVTYHVTKSGSSVTGTTS